MLVEIVPELFMKNLRAIPSKKQVNHLKRLKEISSGAAYLYKAVILPKTQGKEVYTGKVNMTAFDRTDIETVCDYYKENIAAERPENKAFFELYSKISGAPPLNSHSDYIYRGGFVFESNIGDIDHDISVLAMDKILYDNGFSVTDSEIHSDSEYETFIEALLTTDGYIDEEETNGFDCTVIVFRNECIKRYIGLALKYGSMNGIPKGNNFWISRLEAHISNKMRSIGDYSYDWDYNVSSTRKAFLKVYIGPEFYQTVEMIQAIASILHFANTSCKELERLTDKKTAKIIPMKKQKERKMAA